MSGRYDPDPGGEVQWPWSTIQLSTRDVSYQIPVNFVTNVGVSITQACFGQGIYDDRQANKCISNLLAVSYRRFIIDLYWDATLRQYHFCPALFPKTGSATNSVANPDTAAMTSTASLSTVEISTSKRSLISSSTSSSLHSFLQKGNDGNVGRQAPSSTQQMSSGSSNFGTSTMSSTTSFHTISTSDGSTLYQLGRYQCSKALDFQFFTSLVKGYLDATENTLQANVLYIDINLHAALTFDNNKNSTLPSTSQSLPSSSENLGLLLNAVLSTYMYPASQLFADRENLNHSWYSVPRSQYPIAEYFTSNTNTDGSHSSPDGWPSEWYIQVSAHKRLLVGWGAIDSNMQGYNQDNDSDTIFSLGTIQADRQYTANQDENLSAGCFFQQDNTAISSTNSSWASSNLPSSDLSISELSLLASNLTSCGISPILNQTLSSTSASQNLSLYHTLPMASIWNWAPSEPRNASTESSTNSTDKASNFRCALLDLRPNSSPGRWRVADCTAQYPAACRISNHPYRWAVSPDPVPFSSASSACPDNSTFAVPRTALENTYLYHTLLTQRHYSTSSNPSLSSDGVWLDFNSLSVSACWVTGGPDTGCPYTTNGNNGGGGSGTSDQQQRTVIVPIIASIIALVITALTLFVKCNVNRRLSRRGRRKRGEGGWDYEGVPS